MSFVDWVGEVDDGELCYVCDYISENKCPDKGKIIDIGVNHFLFFFLFLFLSEEQSVE